MRIEAACSGCGRHGGEPLGGKRGYLGGVGQVAAAALTRRAAAAGTARWPISPVEVERRRPQLRAARRPASRYCQRQPPRLPPRCAAAPRLRRRSPPIAVSTDLRAAATRPRRGGSCSPASASGRAAPPAAGAARAPASATAAARAVCAATVPTVAAHRRLDTAELTCRTAAIAGVRSGPAARQRRKAPVRDHDPGQVARQLHHQLRAGGIRWAPARDRDAAPARPTSSDTG